MSPDSSQIRDMFNNISGQYDFLNHFLSFGIDRLWRKRVVKEIRKRFAGRLHELQVLDVATGTGDLAISIAALKPASIRGVDIASGMMQVGREKVEARGLSGIIDFTEGAAENLPFPDGAFDAVTVAFGVRNYADLRKGLAEMNRILRPGGVMLVLEFSHPRHFPFRQLYGFYSATVIPAAGRLISGHSHAYRYLPESVAAFPSGAAFLRIMEECGMKNVTQNELSMGIASLYTGEK